jgi:hypothetical protein
MDPSDDSQAGPSESGGHPPIHGRMENTVTRGEKRESTRSGGVSALAELSNQDVDYAIDPNVSSYHAIDDLGERTDLIDIPATQVHSKGLSIRTAKSGSSTRGEDEGHQDSSNKSAEGDRPSDTSNESQISGDKHEDDQFQSDDSQHHGSSDKGQGHQASKDKHEIGQLQDKSKHENNVGTGSSDQGQQGTLKEYDAESRTYHAYYDEVSSASTHNSPSTSC